MNPREIRDNEALIICVVTKRFRGFLGMNNFVGEWERIIVSIRSHCIHQQKV